MLKGLSTITRRCALSGRFARCSSLAPSVPKSFNSANFQIQRDADEKLLLELAHGHALDSTISFDDPKHQYSVNGSVVRQSVTQFVHGFFEEFDADSAIDKMMNGSNWPRPQYSYPNGDVMSKTAIKQKWVNNGNFARNQGTWMHYNIERHFNGLPMTETLTPELVQFLSFVSEILEAKDITAYRTEWRIAAPDHGIAGSVDFVGQLPDGSYALFDWKRAKGFSENLYANYGKIAKFPLEHLDDCDGSKYSLQLNMYRYMLEKYYGINISYMGLVSLHPTQDAYFHTEVPVMDDDIKLLLDYKDSQDGSS